MQIENLEFPSISRELIRDCLLLTGVIWPQKESLEERIERRIAQDAAVSGVIWHLLRKEGEVIAFARSFPRIIENESLGRFPILALASVCTHPEHRGKGYAQSMVKAAWSRLSDDLPVSLFQTAVPDFYKKLGAREIQNPIRNGKENATAFWDPHAMIYPANASWPETAIDLLGFGW